MARKTSRAMAILAVGVSVLAGDGHRPSRLCRGAELKCRSGWRAPPSVGRAAEAELLANLPESKRYGESL